LNKKLGKIKADKADSGASLLFPSSLVNSFGYNEWRTLGLWLRWIEQAPPEQSGTVEETP